MVRVFNAHFNTPKNAEVELTEDQIRQIFKNHDFNNDGQLSKAELRKAFQDLGSRCARFCVSGGICCADSNKDKVIDMDELETLVKYAFQLGYTVK